MKVLVASTYYAPDVCGIAPVSTDLCEELVRRGHQISVLTAYPHYPEWRNKSGKSIWASDVEVLCGVSVLRYGICVPRNPSSLFWRLLYETSLLIGVLRFLFLRTKFDVIYAVCPSFANIVFASLRKLLFGEKVILHIQDIPADAAKAVGLTRGPIGWLALRVQKWLLKSGDLTTSISEEMCERIGELTGARAVFTPNWLVGELGRVLDGVESKGSSVARRDCEPLRLLYSGNIGGKQGLEVFCRILANCDRPFVFTINGAGAGLERLQSCTDIMKDDRFQVGSLLDTHEFVRQLHLADWFVITEKSGVGNAVMPSKMIPAVAMGVPVLAVCDANGSLGKAVAKFGLGIRIPWGDPDAINNVFNMSADDRCQISHSCRLWSQVFGREHNINQVEHLLERHACVQ